MTGVTHVVLVAWDGDDGQGVRADALVQDHLTRIEGVESVRSGTSVSSEGLEGGFDWMLVVRFRDRAALEGYLPHREHQPVAEHIRDGSGRVVVFDIDD